MTGLAGVARAVVLNLDRRRDRLESFLRRSRQAGILQVERIASTDGEQLEVSPELLRLFRDNDFGYRRGVLGCALTHYELWQSLAAAPSGQLTLVFEDDAMFPSGFDAIWNGELAPHLPVNCDLIYLGGLEHLHHAGPALVEQRHVLAREQCPYAADTINPWFVRPRRINFCTYAYAMRGSAARSLCRIIQRNGIQRAIDWFVTDHWQCLSVCAAAPLVCWAPTNGDSDIQSS